MIGYVLPDTDSRQLFAVSLRSFYMYAWSQMAKVFAKCLNLLAAVVFCPYKTDPNFSV
jgi:hypothetical protein